MVLRIVLLAAALLAALALLGESGVTGPTGAAGQAGASPVADRRPVDLAAVVLTPDELGLPGASLANHGGSSRFVSLSEIVVSDDASTALVAAGWRRTYEGTLVTLSPADDLSYQEIVVVRVSEYAGEAGAATGFDVVVREWVTNGVKVERVLSSIGDRVAVARWSGGAEDTGAPFRAAMIAFPTGDVTVSVTVYDLTGRDPDSAFLDRLAATLAGKIDAAAASRDGGLGNRVLRLAGDDVQTIVDRYERQHGEVMPIAGETADQREWRHDAYRGAVEAYLLTQELNGGTVLYRVRLASFPDATAASAALADARTRLADHVGEGGAVLPLLRADEFGDESLTLAVSRAMADGRTRDGYVVAARVGSELAEVAVEAEAGVRLGAVHDLARAQAACLAVDSCLTPSQPPIDMELSSEDSPHVAKFRPAPRFRFHRGRRRGRDALTEQPLDSAHRSRLPLSSCSGWTGGWSTKWAPSP